MKYITLIVMALMLTACRPSGSYIVPQASARALEMCAPYGGLGSVGTTTYEQTLKITAYCNDDTRIEHRIPR